ncbi:zinc finger protein [Loa loa]|uniref:Zinc finger protein n=1 Tax=Loa loa TaxID=7209 RepID=A0A1S0TQZ2_LOALO|nr:zinc finger protein [Loa loa]EFO18514.1 zinc finger protein [Loa loa]
MSLCRTYFAHEQSQGIGRTQENARRTIYLQTQTMQLWANIQSFINIRDHGVAMQNSINIAMQKMKPSCGKVFISFGAVRQHLENICSNLTAAHPPFGHALRNMRKHQKLRGIFSATKTMSVLMSDVLSTRTVPSSIRNTRERTANHLFANANNPLVSKSTIVARHYSLTRKPKSQLWQILQPQVHLAKIIKQCFVTSR